MLCADYGCQVVVSMSGKPGAVGQLGRDHESRRKESHHRHPQEVGKTDDATGVSLLCDRRMWSVR